VTGNEVGALLVVVFAAALLWDVLTARRSWPRLYWLVTGIALLGVALYFRTTWASVCAGAFVLWCALDVRGQWRRRRMR
jgi:hypothetical protein